MAEGDSSYFPEDVSTTSPTAYVVEPTERTPLLTGGQAPRAPGKRPTPLPRLQIATLLLLQLSEPVTSQSIYPFINELVKNLDVTGGDERKAGYYAGLLESLFFAAEATTVLFWSRLSDLVGRRPVLFVGFTGLSISMVSFGLSRTFLQLVFSRCLAGSLNGYSGVIKSMMGEMTDSSNMAQAFAYMPVVWSVGATIGPFIGGELSRPAERFPQIFGNSPFWSRYPYFLPCAVSAIFPVISLVVVLVMLKEARAVRRPRLTSMQSYASQFTPGAQIHHESSTRKIDNDGSTVAFSSLEGQLIVAKDAAEAPPSIRSILTRRVFVAVLNYALLSLIDIAFLSVEPLFYATSISLGGLGLSPPTIGLCLGLYGMLMGTFQALFFAKFHGWLGSKKLLILTLFVNIPIFTLFPVINFLARKHGMIAITWAALCFQLCLCMFSDMSGGCAFIFVTLSAPNKRSLGATNGLVATVTAAIRAIGPAATTSLFAASIEHNLFHGLLVYIILIGIVIVALLAASLLPANEEDWERA